MKTILRTKFSLLLLLITFAAQAQRWKDSLHFRRSVADRHSLRLSDSALNALGIDSILNKMEEAHYTHNRNRPPTSSIQNWSFRLRLK